MSKKNDTSDCVSCTVTNCSYHDQEDYCTADHIIVSGDDVNCKADTICGTYRKKD